MELKWSLPSSVVECANHHFNANVPDKDIEEQLLTENPVPSNLQQVKPLDNFIRSLLVSQTVTTSDHQMGRVSGKNSGWNGSFIPPMERVRGHP